MGLTTNSVMQSTKATFECRPGWEDFGPPVFTVHQCRCRHAHNTAVFFVYLMVVENCKYAIIGSVWKVLKFDFGLKWESRPRTPRSVDSGWSWSWQAVRQNNKFVPFWIRAGGKWWNHDKDAKCSEQTACPWPSWSSGRWNSHAGQFLYII